MAAASVLKLNGLRVLYLADNNLEAMVKGSVNHSADADHHWSV